MAVPRLDPRNLLRPSFSPYSCAVSWICFRPCLCLYSTILTNGALSKIPWRVRYLARVTIDRLKFHGVSPEFCPKLQVKIETLCSCFQPETSKENVLVVYKSHEAYLGYFTSTSRLQLAQCICLPCRNTKIQPKRTILCFFRT